MRVGKVGKWRKKEDVEVGPRVDDKIVNDLLFFVFMRRQYCYLWAVEI